MAGAAARRGPIMGRVRTKSNEEVLRFWPLAPCDVEARVRRLKWAQTLVQDPAHHTQLITATFGKLPSEPNPTLGHGDEISPEANPWAVRWMADLEELEPYGERVVIQRVGRDVRALFLDRELAEDFCRNGRHDITTAVAGGRGPTVGFSGRSGSVGGRSSTVEVLFR